MTSRPHHSQHTISSPYSSTSIGNSVAAGYVAGICGTVVGHPLDSIKVMLQTQSNPLATPTPTASGYIQRTLATIVAPRCATATANTAITISTRAQQQANMSTLAAANPSRQTPTVIASRMRSLRALYAGVTGPLLTVGIIRSFNFAMFDTTRRILYSYEHHDLDHHHTSNISSDDYVHNDSIRNVAIASIVSGAATTVITSPLIVIKTKQQLMLWGFRQAFSDTMRSSGTKMSIRNWHNFYVGYGPHFIACSLGHGVYMSTYEILKRSFMERNQAHNYPTTTTVLSTSGVTIQERMICAAIAGMTCWSIIFPADVLQNRMYKQSITGGKESTWEMAKSMYQQHGNSIRPFYRGFAVTVCRAGPVAAAVLPVYDMSLEYMSSSQS